MRPLGLHQITAMEVSPSELVAVAAAVGCQAVCVFVHVPEQSLPGRAGSVPFPLVTRETKSVLVAKLAEHTIEVSNLEFFPITAEMPIGRYREALALGRELGAQRAVAHIHEDDSGRAVESLGQFCELAAEFELSVGLEFMGLTPACNSLSTAVRLVDQVARDNLGIAIDALHLVRTGGSPADLQALPPSYFSYGQICDGRGLATSSDYLSEALDRMMPGDGDFPLPGIIAALPRDLPLDVEVPSPTLAQRGLPALGRAREAVERSRRLLQHAEADD